ncbi:MAG: hypothetical protein A3J38_00390 [Gammaproteobacteria bacterium RIFCSPHIGHO2_12_FULL_45_9]|nr:MAG: hypothetical protein A3J38_00390 [Gammaproteobacteria bacterium RIFCSPHIGHO2_12_FULL_45_9]
MPFATIDLHPTHSPLTASWLETQLGTMLAVANATALCHLVFADEQPCTIPTQNKISFEVTPLLISLQQELTAYFAGQLKTFTIPLLPLGTPFQKQAWDALCQVPYGETHSYAEQARTIGRPTAYRAVANANGANPIAIIIPCHRIIASNGHLGGYSSGIHRKQWLLQHEAHVTHHAAKGNPQ